MRPDKLYLDLDGVFADFNSAVRYHLQSNDWSPLGWKVLEKVPNLFYSLDVLPGAINGFEELRDICYTYNVKMEILTALPRPTGMLVTAPKDKFDWVRKHLDSEIPVNCSAGWENKVHWVSKSHVLIDDMRRNIDHWNECGGIGIQHTGDWESTVKKFYSLVHPGLIRS